MQIYEKMVIAQDVLDRRAEYVQYGDLGLGEILIIWGNLQKNIQLILILITNYIIS